MNTTDIIVIVGSGAFGGLLHAIHFKDGKLSYPRHFVDTNDGSKYLLLGMFSDILLGAGAAIIATIPLGLDSPIKEVYVSMIAGFGGGSFIAKQAKKSEISKKDLIKTLPSVGAEIEELIETGDSYEWESETK